NTLIESNKRLIKDEEAEDVDVHLYRSMIGSLMYLIASRHDITFDVCAYARFQVTPKTLHLHAVKRIFRYLKGQPKLGLWYPKDSPFDLEAYSNSNYARASLDMKSITGGCQFLGKRLISWQCKKQTIVDNSTTETEYVAAANYRGQNKQKPRKKQRQEVEASHDESEDEDRVPTPSNDLLPSEEIDQDDEIALDAETQGRTHDDEMSGVDDVFRDEVVTTVTNKVSAAPIIDVTKDEITMVQALAALKSIKPKVMVQEQEVSTTIRAAATKVITDVPNPRAKEADSLLAKRLQAREREEFSEVQKARLGRSYDEVKNLFDREMRKINSFIAMDSEAQKSSEKKAQESSTKRTTESLESEISKKQKVDENVEPVIDDTEELKKYMEIVPDDRDEVLIEATPISSRSPTIIDYKNHKEGKKNYFKINKADVNSQVYQTLKKMFKNFNREDVEVLWAIVNDKFKKEKPVDDMDNLMFRTLKTMFELHVEDIICTYQTPFIGQGVLVHDITVMVIPKIQDYNLPGSGIFFLLAVSTFFTSSGNFYCQWELYTWQWECLVHFIPNNPPLNLMLQLQSSFQNKMIIWRGCHQSPSVLENLQSCISSKSNHSSSVSSFLLEACS
nr:putative ribonuclease H-like domain-containing protein [Tanacetum cinerariifolium]